MLSGNQKASLTVRPPHSSVGFLTNLLVKNLKNWQQPHGNILICLILINGHKQTPLTNCKMVVLMWYLCMDRLDFSHDSILLHSMAILSSGHAYAFCKPGP